MKTEFTPKALVKTAPMGGYGMGKKLGTLVWGTEYQGEIRENVDSPFCFLQACCEQQVLLNI